MEPSVSGAAASETVARDSQNSSLTLSYEELTWQGAERNLGPAEPVAEPAPDNDAPGEPAEVAAAQPQSSFTRIAGGAGFFCGSLKAGPIRCWGERDELIVGGFVDVAVGERATCGVTMGGEVQCRGETTPPPITKAKRIVSNGLSRFCVVDFNQHMTCWGRVPGVDPDAMPSVLNDPKVNYMVLSTDAGCLVDPHKTAHCWGQGALPDEPVEHVRDLAAGDEFVCALGDWAKPGDDADEQGNSDTNLRCWGLAPRLPAGEYASIHAAFGTLCGRTADGGLTCRGSNVQDLEKVEQAFVGRSSLCVRFNDNTELSCFGDDNAGQLEVPRASAPPEKVKERPPAHPPELVAAFVQLFPVAQAPYQYDRAQRFSFGGRVPARFAPILPMNPNLVRIGERLDVGHELIAVTLLAIDTGELSLHIFSKDGEHRSQILLASISRQGPYATEGQGDGESVGRRGKTVESKITADRVEVTIFEGEEITNYVAEHLDGTRPIFNIQCNIRRTSYTEEIQKSGQLRRKNALLKPIRSTADMKGCSGEWPL